LTASSTKPKVILLGIDGFDPKILSSLMDQGELPNFARLAAQGCFSPLETVFPPQSPVVWTSIATGLAPAEHGIADFLTHKHDAYQPELAILRQGKLGYVRPYQAKTFWEEAGEHGIPATILKWPLTFPATPMYGRLLAGLGTPDIRGTLGRYTLFTTRNLVAAGDLKGTINHVKINGDFIKTELTGPFGFSFQGARPAAVPLEIELSAGAISCRLDGTSFSLAVGAWSDWLQVDFKVGFLRTVRGMCRFYLEGIEPDFSLYATPVNISCESQTLPVSYPLGYAKELAAAVGNYATLGLAEDANALKDLVIDERAFIQICDNILAERERVFFHALQGFQEGILACVFDTPDRIQHMFWRFQDPGHPLYHEAEARLFAQIIPGMYRRLDGILGRTLEKVDRHTLILVFSDHGFTNFQWSVHLNTWFLANGFMALQNGHTAGRDLFQDVDWSQTTAFALGLNSVFLNLQGREGQGIVEPGAQAAVRADLARKLETLTFQGRPVIKTSHIPAQPAAAGGGSRLPDLIIGYDKGFRASWQTAVGGAPQGDIIQANLEKWSGDHCCDPGLVPGIFLASEKNLLRKPHVQTICPAILDYLGITRR
jgi:predicted AlkP superfamily phosphohydrolase/phosphomutase